MLTNGPDPISQMVEIISLLAPFLGDRGPPSAQSRSNATVHHRSYGKCHPNYCQYSSRPQFSVLIVAIFKKRLGCNPTLIYASFPGYTRGLAGPMSISVMLVVLILLLFTTSYRRVFAALVPSRSRYPRSSCQFSQPHSGYLPFPKTFKMEGSRRTPSTSSLTLFWSMTTVYR
jgi:hypothetical protein